MANPGEGTQEVIDGLEHGRIAVDSLARYASLQLHGMADMGMTEPYKRLLNAYKRLNEISSSLNNIKALLELHGQSGLWRATKKGG